MGKQSHRNRTKSTPASQDVFDIMHIIPEAEEGINHQCNYALVPKVVQAELDKLPPWRRREVVAKFLCDRAVAIATAACAAAKQLGANATDKERVEAAIAAGEKERVQWD